IIDWLRDRFGKLRSTSERGGRKLFISRAGNPHAHNRRVLNEAEIAGIAVEQGFEIIRGEEIPFETQVKLFSEASIIAGPHGAGFANMVFAPQGTKIIEMIGPRYSREQQPGSGSRPYVEIASALRCNFVRLVGCSDESARVHMDHIGFETYTIDPTEF